MRERRPSRDQTRRELVYRPLQFQKCGQHFIGSYDETLSVAMRVHNPDRSPLRDPRLRSNLNSIQLAEIVADDFPILHAHPNAMNVFGITDKLVSQKFIYPVIAAVTGPILTCVPPAFFGTYSRNCPLPSSIVRPPPMLSIVFSPKRVIV